MELELEERTLDACNLEDPLLVSTVALSSTRLALIVNFLEYNHTSTIAPQNHIRHLKAQNSYGPYWRPTETSASDRHFGS